MKSIALAVLAACLAVPARAEPACAQTSIMYEVLAEHHGESRRATGFTNDMGAWVELWGEEDGSWSLIVSTPDGQSCLITYGIGFQAFAAPPNL